MIARRKARETALQSLFQSEFEDTLPATLMGSKIDADEETLRYSRHLVEGVRSHLGSIDELIQTNSHNWKVYRMALVDKNILRIAIYEMVHSPEKVPVRAVINEAIELAKRFGSGDSRAFINGILDQIAKSNGAQTGT
jgi:transcription antitermination protein NusB